MCAEALYCVCVCVCVCVCLGLPGAQTEGKEA